MRKIVLFMLATIMAACSSTDETMPVETAEVTLTFTPYEVAPITRAATTIADYCTRLDLWLYESGTEFGSVHQSSTDDTFGTITLTLDKTKTYTLYAAAHKGTAPATLTSSVITFPDDKTTHTLYYTTTFTPSATTQLSCLMTRIVSQFRMETTDPVPEACKQLRFTLSNVYDRWSVTDGPTHQVDRVSTVALTSLRNDGTVAVSIHAIATDAQTAHTVTVEALDASGASIQSRTFENVPLRNGYRTSYTGAFFIDTPMTMTFTANDWIELTPVSF